MVGSNGFVMTPIASYSRYFACSSFITLAVMKMTRVSLNASVSQRARSASSPSIPASWYPGQTSQAPFQPPAVPPNLQHHRSLPWKPPRVFITSTPISWISVSSSTSVFFKSAHGSEPIRILYSQACNLSGFFSINRWLHKLQAIIAEIHVVPINKKCWRPKAATRY